MRDDECAGGSAALAIDNAAAAASSCLFVSRGQLAVLAELQFK